MSCLIKPIEPCHSEPCDGLDEVLSLLPKGALWDASRESTYSNYVRALGHIKSCWNARICQEWNELNPCTSVRLFDYWADLYSFPSCVDQTREKLCEWIDLLSDPDCPVGSVGFLSKAVEFFAPDIELTFVMDGIGEAGCLAGCSCGVHIVLSAPPNLIYYDPSVIDNPNSEISIEKQLSGIFIPEINCIKNTIFPFGVPVLIATLPNNGDNSISGVPIENTGVNDFA